MGKGWEGICFCNVVLNQKFPVQRNPGLKWKNGPYFQENVVKTEIARPANVG